MRAISGRLHDLQEKYRDRADFLLVYILEAHAQDEWPICSSRCSPGGKKILYNQHKTLEERTQAAKDFIEAFDFKIPTVLDNMENDFESKYSAWPLRIYAVRQGQVEYKAMPRDGMYHLEELEAYLDNVVC